MLKLFEHYSWQNLLKFYDKKDLSTRIRITAIRLKFGGKILTFLNKQVPEGKASICSTIKENLLFYCRKFSALVVLVII